MKTWCRIYSCWREALQGSEFCAQHAHQAPKPKPVKK